jgi:hypothetical protein
VCVCVCVCVCGCVLCLCVCVFVCVVFVCPSAGRRFLRFAEPALGFAEPALRFAGPVLRSAEPDRRDGESRHRVSRRLHLHHSSSLHRMAPRVDNTLVFNCSRIVNIFVAACCATRGAANGQLCNAMHFARGAPLGIGMRSLPHACGSITWVKNRTDFRTAFPLCLLLLMGEGLHCPPTTHVQWAPQNKQAPG